MSAGEPGSTLHFLLSNSSFLLHLLDLLLLIPAAVAAHELYLESASRVSCTDCTVCTDLHAGTFTSLTSMVYQGQAWGWRRPANQGESTDITFWSISLQILPTWIPDSPRLRQMFGFCLLEKRSPAAPPPCVRSYIRTEICLCEWLTEEADWSVRQAQEDDSFILRSPTWSLSEPRYIITFYNTLWQLLRRDYDVQRNRNKIGAGRSSEQTSFPPPKFLVQRPLQPQGQVTRTMTDPWGALCSVRVVPWLLCMAKSCLLGTSLLVTTSPSRSLCGELLLTNGAFINRTMFN